jgi:hypothetical protein
LIFIFLSVISVYKEAIMGKKIKKFNALKAHKAAARKAHFAAGRTLAMWRGRAATLDESTSKARKNKLACRGWKLEHSSE